MFTYFPIKHISDFSYSPSQNLDFGVRWSPNLPAPGGCPSEPWPDGRRTAVGRSLRRPGRRSSLSVGAVIRVYCYRQPSLILLLSFIDRPSLSPALALSLSRTRLRPYHVLHSRPCPPVRSLVCSSFLSVGLFKPSMIIRPLRSSSCPFVLCASVSILSVLSSACLSVSHSFPVHCLSLCPFTSVSVPCSSCSFVFHTTLFIRHSYLPFLCPYLSLSVLPSSARPFVHLSNLSPYCFSSAYIYRFLCFLGCFENSVSELT